MEPALEYISNMGQTILNLARQFTFKDAVDVAIVTVLLYGVIKLVRETRAGQLVKGIILLVVLFLISSWQDLLMLNAILCKGHVLIEDVPGVGKTTLASALAR